MAANETPDRADCASDHFIRSPQRRPGGSKASSTNTSVDMTHILELRGSHLRTIEHELVEPSLTSEEVTGDGGQLPSTVIDNWNGIQTLVSNSIRSRRQVITEPEVSQYVAAVIRYHSFWWHKLEHHDDGAGFRADITDNVASVLGISVTAGLVRRPMFGLVADSHPYYGWAANHELAEALGRLNTAIPPREQQTSELHAILNCVRAAINRGYDLVTVYASCADI